LLIMKDQIGFAILFAGNKPVDSISNRTRIILLAKWIDIYIELVSLKIAAHILREARTDAYQPVLVTDRKRWFRRANYGAELILHIEAKINAFRDSLQQKYIDLPVISAWLICMIKILLQFGKFPYVCSRFY
jgi:hypothetical protein